MTRIGINYRPHQRARTEQYEFSSTSLRVASENSWNLPRTKKVSTGHFFALPKARPSFRFRRESKKRDWLEPVSFFGDPYGNRTHVTAVKGRCLNRLTNGPGSGDLTRTGDRPGMNRVLYQLSYAAMLFRFRNQLRYYIQRKPICQAFFEDFFTFFWESCQ